MGMIEFINFFKKNTIYIGAGCLLIILIILASIFIFQGSKSISLHSDYDIQRDYCGKAIDIHYCQCAFEGEFCEAISTSGKDAVNKLVIAGFEKWVIEQKKKECAEKSGYWVNDGCKAKN